MKQSQNSPFAFKFKNRDIKLNTKEIKTKRSPILPQKQKQTTFVFKTSRPKSKEKQDTIESYYKSTTIYKQLQQQFRFMQIKNRSQITKLKDTQITKLRQFLQLSQKTENLKNQILTINQMVNKTQQELQQQKDDYYYMTNQNPEQHGSAKDDESSEQSYYESLISLQQQNKTQNNKYFQEASNTMFYQQNQ